MRDNIIVYNSRINNSTELFCFIFATPTTMIVSMYDPEVPVLLILSTNYGFILVILSWPIFRTWFGRVFRIINLNIKAPFAVKFSI